MGALGSLFSFGQGAATYGAATGQAGAIRTRGEVENRLAQLNANTLRLQAKDAVDRGNQEASAAYRESLMQGGAQRAAAAASGQDPDSGSAAILRAESQQLAEQDIMQIKANAWRQRWGFEQEAEAVSAAGRIAEFSARSDAASTLSTGALRAAAYGLEGISKLEPIKVQAEEKQKEKSKEAAKNYFKGSKSEKDVEYDPYAGFTLKNTAKKKSK